MWLLLETSFLRTHKKETTGRAVLESATRKEWKRKRGTAFISFYLIFGRVGRDLGSLSQPLQIQGDGLGEQIPVQISFKNFMWKEFVISATANPNKKTFKPPAVSSGSRAKVLQIKQFMPQRTYTSSFPSGLNNTDFKNSQI